MRTRALGRSLSRAPNLNPDPEGIGIFIFWRQTGIEGRSRPATSATKRALSAGKQSRKLCLDDGVARRMSRCEPERLADPCRAHHFSFENHAITKYSGTEGRSHLFLVPNSALGSFFVSNSIDV